MLRRSSFKPKRQAPPASDRAGEFESFEPKARTPAPGGGVLTSLTREPLAPQSVTTSTTEAEREYMGRVARLGCVVCRLLGFGATPAQVHHIRTGQGGAQRAGNYCVLPLCEPHHTGPRGIHGDRACLRQLNMTEMDLLDITIGDVYWRVQ